MLKGHKIIYRLISCTATLIVALSAWSCSARMKPAAEMAADSFLSEVRYLISRQERKQFKKLPPSERAAFIDAFWKIRDPDPETELNEYREEYFKRIEQANHLFREGGSGWLSDRGRIFILIGEPDRRDTYPTGYNFYDPPLEIWHYGFFTIAFIDYERDGSYRLSPESGQKLNAINLAQMHFKPEGLAEDAGEFHFQLAFTSESGAPALLVSIPFSVISFAESDSKERYSTRFIYELIISDEQGKTASERKGSLDVSVTPKEFLRDNGQFKSALPLDLSPGRYRAVLYLENETDKKRKGQSVSFKVR